MRVAPLLLGLKTVVLFLYLLPSKEIKEVEYGSIRFGYSFSITNDYAISIPNSAIRIYLTDIHIAFNLKVFVD